MYIKIYFKNCMEVTWVLHEYTYIEFIEVTQIILKKTKRVKCYCSKGIITCTNKKELNKIYSILMKWYRKYHVYDENIKTYLDFSYYEMK